jgi:hypothetical protein
VYAISSVYANPVWLLVAVLAFGLGRLTQVAGRTCEALHRLEGWRTDEGSRIGHKGPSVLDALEQIHDNLT